jgi:hypothetical protein
MSALSHNDPRFDDVDYQPDYGGNTVPQRWRKHKASCCCYDCMKKQREAATRAARRMDIEQIKSSARTDCNLVVHRKQI